MSAGSVYRKRKDDTRSFRHEPLPTLRARDLASVEEVHQAVMVLIARVVLALAALASVDLARPLCLANNSSKSLRDHFLALYKGPSRVLFDYYGAIDITYRVAYRTSGVQQRQEGDDELQLRLIVTPDGNMLFHDDNNEEAWRDGCWRLPRNGHSVFGANKRYEFEIAVAPNNKTVLRSTRLLGSGQYPLTQPLMAPIMDITTNRPIIDVVRDPHTRVISLGPAQYHGQRVEELVLETTGYPGVSQRRVRVECRYYFRRDRSWLCVGQRTAFLETEDGAWAETRVEHDGSAPLPAIKRIHYIFAPSRDGRQRQDQLFDVLRFRRSGEIPAAAFRLTAFGLPEPPGVEWEEPIPPVHWAVAIGIGLIVIGVGVFGYFRRRAAKAA